MTKPVELGDEAAAEVASAATWYEQQRPGLSRELLGEIDRALGSSSGG